MKIRSDLYSHQLELGGKFPRISIVTLVFANAKLQLCGLIFGPFFYRTIVVWKNKWHFFSPKKSLFLLKSFSVIVVLINIIFNIFVLFNLFFNKWLK